MSQGLTRHRAGVIIAIGALAASAAAETVEITASRDCGIFSNGNASGAGNIFSGRTGPQGGFNMQRALVAFDVASAIPAGATILAADLTLHLSAASPFSGDQVHSLHRVGASWGEGTSESSGGLGAPPTPNDATWTNRFHPGMPWAAAGGDFAAAPSGSLVVGFIPGPLTWSSTPQMVADVQSWLDDPSGDHGWILLGNEKDAATAKKFQSRESGDPAEWPRLLVTYEAGSADCSSDLDGSGDVGFGDLLAVLANWGPCPGCPEDLDGNGDVGFSDLLEILADWGPCP